jgi:hypothetical protein
LGYTPAVFVRVASKGLAGYGKWKSAQKHENKGNAKTNVCRLEGLKVRKLRRKERKRREKKRLLTRDLRGPSRLRVNWRGWRLKNTHKITMNA